MKNILVPIDFSAYSLSAAKTAGAMAAKSEGRIHLLHLLPEVPVNWDSLSVAKQQDYPMLEGKMVEAKIKLERFSRQPFFKDSDVIFHVQGGVAFEQINLFAKKNKMDLIVMGAHGDGESELKFIGSTAQRVIRAASVPVLSVKKNYNPGSIKKIMFASDFNPEVKPAMNTVKNLASTLGANLDLVYINTPGHFLDDNTMEARMQKFVGKEGPIKFNTVIQNSNTREEGILECATKRNTDMIAIVTHLRTHKPSYQIGTAETVLLHSNVPVLSFVSDGAK
jgi:nucleotide-binding universal stress UspA family protein